MAMLLILGSLLFLLIAPRFMARSREGRIRIAGMIFGCYLMALGVLTTAFATYASFDSGTAWLLSRRHSATEISFATDPLLATFAFMGTIICTASFVALGRYIFNIARRGTLGP